MASLSHVFKAYDIRGVVPDDLNALQFRAIGVAVARFTGAPTILVARDMRESGVELSESFALGARSEGATVVDLGLASTDLLYYAAGSLDAPGAMFTASHNPAKYNGLKLCQAGARPIGRDTGLAEIQAITEQLLDTWAADGPPEPDRAPRAPSSTGRSSTPTPTTSGPSWTLRCCAR
jgi:phosphomannomutase